jgi:hypothetical protein
MLAEEVNRKQSEMVVLDVGGVHSHSLMQHGMDLSHRSSVFGQNGSDVSLSNVDTMTRGNME